jgi:uncharacterized membrane protein
MRVSAELDGVVVGRPIGDVFAFISEMENGPLWGRTLSTVKVSMGPVSVGTVFREQAQGEDQTLEKQTEVTEFLPPETFSYTSRYENGMTERAHISFDSVAGGTLVRPSAEVEIPEVPQEQETAFSREMQETVRSLLDNLKRVLETPGRASERR